MDIACVFPLRTTERIFEAYQRAHATAGQPGSVGLGLTVSRTLAELMGGTLRYVPDVGSCFEVTLPAAIAPSSGDPAQTIDL